MNRLSIINRLYKELKTKTPIWWSNLKSDPDLYIEIRKNNKINVYYNGGAVISELSFNKKGYSGKIHNKYLVPNQSKYIQFDFSGKSLIDKNLHLNIIDLNNTEIALIKHNIALYYPKHSEKGIQASFIRNSGSFLDSEFAYKDATTDIRIDLVLLDTTNKKIVLIELKTIGDQRLFNGEIANQLQKYHDFAVNYKPDIESYYKTLFLIKKDLGILPSKLSMLKDLTDYTLEVKPLLLLGDCHKSWINKNALGINENIKSVAYGAYYFGAPRYNCDLIKRSKGNRFVF